MDNLALALMKFDALWQFMSGVVCGAILVCILGSVLEFRPSDPIVKFFKAIFWIIKLPFKILWNHRLIRLIPRLWRDWIDSAASYRIRSVIAMILFRFGFMPKTSGYSTGEGSPPDLESAGWWRRDSIYGEMLHWFPLPLEYLRDEEGNLKREYW